MHTVRVLVTGSQGEPRSGDVSVQHWNQRSRLLRAGKWLALCWLGAIVFVFIPLVHFFLVPALLLGGLVLAYFVYGQEGTILGGKATCPKCGADFKIIRTKEAWPFRDVCSACFENVTITRKD